MLRRDRAILLTALAALVLLAWAYLVWIAGSAEGDAGAAEMLHRAAPQLASWSAFEFAAMFAMWSIMMVAMMVPSAAPMILLYARVGRQAAGKGRPFAAAGWFASGYLFAWAGFAAVATGLQWLLEQAMLLTPMAGAAAPRFGGVLLIAAGLYQWTSLKDACLSQCQSPLLFIQRHGGFRAERAGAAALGLRHGAYCIGCCWVLMLLLFVGGVMNLLWIAALAVLILTEKVVPRGRLFSRLVGSALVAAGLALAAGATS